MAFTRKFLSALGIEADKIEQIIESHVDVVDGLKNEIETLKADSDSVSELKKQLEAANKKLAAAEKDDYKGKYEAEKAKHEKLKAQIAADKERNAKETAYREILKKAGIPDKRISAVLRITDLDKVEFDEKNAVKDADKEIENIKAEYGGLIPTTEITGSDPETPLNTSTEENKGTGIAAQIQKEFRESMYGKTDKEG